MQQGFVGFGILMFVVFLIKVFKSPRIGYLIGWLLMLSPLLWMMYGISFVDDRGSATGAMLSFMTCYPLGILVSVVTFLTAMTIRKNSINCY